MTLFYFTSTGNSLSVAKAFNGQPMSMVQVMKEEENVHQDDVIGLVFPCYRSSIPTIVEHFLKTQKLKADYLFTIITYGNMTIGAEGYFEDTANKYGHSFNYINRLKMVDNSLNYFDMDKEVKALPKKGVENHLDKIVSDVKNRSVRTRVNNPISIRLSKLGDASYRKMIGDVDKKFLVENHCTECGICEKVCPVNNITMEKGPTFHHECIACFACTHQCPSNAIRYEAEKSKARYRHHDISLREIVNANK